MVDVNTAARVLVFDSGVGGLSVLSHLQQRLPNLTISYVMDDAWCPYGEKADSRLQERMQLVMARAIERCQPDLVVVACNTASTLSLQSFRQAFSLPFVGVVPAIKPAYEKTASGAVVLLATAATVQRDYVMDLWSRFGQGRSLIRLACPELVAMAEGKLRGQIISTQLWQELVENLRRKLKVELRHDESVAAFVLGCTHFPLVRDELVRAWGESCLWLDSGAAVAERVANLLVSSERACAGKRLVDGGKDRVQEVAARRINQGTHKGGTSGICWHTSEQLDVGLAQRLTPHQLQLAGCLFD